MKVITGPDVSCSNKVTRIPSPSISMGEDKYISGFSFSKKMAKKLGVEQQDLINAYNKNPKAFKRKHARLVKTIESDGAGGPTKGENYVKIWIDVDIDDRDSGSEANYIWLYFGRERRVKLLSGGRFPANSLLIWDLNDISEWLEDYVGTDQWDEIALITDSVDGIRISKICLIHSSQTILDWECDLWLDGSKGEKYGKLVFTAKILETKLNQIDNMWVPQIHWAAREIGKTDKSKYDATDAWCSDFARWCLEKAFWEDMPPGEIGTGDMEDYFKPLGRLYEKDQLLNGEYRLVAGDYIRFLFRDISDKAYHSGIFIEYIDDPSDPTEATTFRTIEGNYCSVGNEEHTVGLATRTFKDIYQIGCCR